MPYYEPKADVVKMPFPERFISTEEYYAAKLHETYHATGHASRENRKEKQTHNIKNFAFEEMRAEMFSMLAGARFDLPMPESNSAAYINKWNQTFSGGDAKAVFQAAAEAAKVLTIMHQFEMAISPGRNGSRAVKLGRDLWPLRRNATRPPALIWKNTRMSRKL